MVTCDSFNRSDLLGFPGPNGIRGEHFLKKVSEKVSTLRRKKFPLKSPAGAVLTIGRLEDPEYRDKADEVHGCSRFYLPNPVRMEVIGYTEGTFCPCDQLILMICEDGKVFGYDGDELHLVAPSVKHLEKDGIEYPSSKSWCYGEAFKEKTKEDWDEVRRGSVGRRLEEQRHERAASRKSRVSEILRLNRLKQRSLQQHGSPLPEDIRSQLKNPGTS